MKNIVRNIATALGVALAVPATLAAQDASDFIGKELRAAEGELTFIVQFFEDGLGNGINEELGDEGLLPISWAVRDGLLCVTQRDGDFGNGDCVSYQIDGKQITLNLEDEDGTITGTLLPIAGE